MGRKVVRWIAFAVALVAVLWGVSVGFTRLEYATDAPGRGKVWLIVSYSTFAVFGALLGFEKLLAERRQPGNWKVSVLRLVFGALPALIVGLWYFIANWIDIALKAVPPSVTAYVNPIFLQSQAVVYMAMTIFGYLVITSFHKQESIPRASYRRDYRSRD